jgi:hypothetical protein
MTEGVEHAGKGAEKDGEQCDLVGGEAQLRESSRSRVDAMDQVIAVLGQVQAQPLRVMNRYCGYYLKFVRHEHTLKY